MRPILGASLAKLTATLLCAGAPQMAQSPAPGPESLVARFIDAWNTHDASSFGKLFAPDADWVTASGQRLRGRDRIQAFLAEEHAGWAKRTRMRSLGTHVRTLAEGVAVFFEWEISGDAAEAGTPVPPRRGNNLFVVAQAESGWVIVAGQVARKP